ncbi:MAG TPA: hypothetical protein VN256_03430 [Pyrinomonadaceae bacterium]|nr:hypothetical protein [Pyrinomonadaceae bacterium]
MSMSTVKKARFYAVPKSEGDKELVEVHFNPASLQYTISNTPAQGSRTTQHVAESSAKLTMDLIFDTTDKGEDVRVTTRKVANLMKAKERQGQRRGQGNNTPPKVLFEWGTFGFEGLVESYKETIDFFSSEGVPLRASVNLTMAGLDKVFDKQDDADEASPGENAVDVPAGGGRSATDTAAAGGDPGAGRDIAAANGEESMRFPSGPMTVDPSVQLSPPAAFASGGASIGAGGAAGFGAGVGVGGSASFGLGAGVGASFGGSASAGVTASAGAFAGLRVTNGSRRPPLLDVERLVKRSESVSVATDGGARFRLGGRAVFEESTSLGAGVRGGAHLRGRIRFEES